MEIVVKQLSESPKHLEAVGLWIYREWWSKRCDSPEIVLSQLRTHQKLDAVPTASWRWPRESQSEVAASSRTTASIAPNMIPVGIVGELYGLHYSGSASGSGSQVPESEPPSFIFVWPLQCWRLSSQKPELVYLITPVAPYSVQVVGELYGLHHSDSASES